MSSTIQTPSLFAEAAYGPEGMPGLGGVTGGGEVHQSAWQTAMSDAQSELEPTVPTGLEESPVSPTDAYSTVDRHRTEISMNTGEMKAQHPLSWDRLSMTVASMVAWNMQVSLADDAPSGLMTEELTDRTGQQPELLTGSGEFEQPDEVSALINTVEAEAGFLTTKPGDVNQTNGSVNSAETFSPYESSSEVSPPFRLDPGSVKSEAHLTAYNSPAGVGLEADMGGAVEQAPNPSVSPSTSKTMASNSFDAPSTQATMSIPAAINPLDDSIRPDLGAKITSMTSDKTQSVTPDFVRQNAADTGNRYPEIEGVIRVNKTSVSAGGLDAAAQRLQGVRAALAQLDAQAVVRAQVASVHSGEVSGDIEAPLNLDEAQAPKPVKTALSSAKSVALGDTPIKAHKARLNDVGSTVKPSAETEVEPSSEPYRSPVRGLEPKDSTRVETLRSIGAVLTPGATDGLASQTTAEFSAGYVGLENAEISADQDMMVEAIVTDSENIEAGEVPELPIQDTSQLDIDIDDQAGRVRVAMTKDGQDVAVRLETPQEVLEEYREMKSEMEEAMARKGLELSDFSASGHDGGDGEGDESGTLRSESPTELNQRGLESGVGEDALEESGATARLVNRIV
jgi:hypothetical protein